MPDPKRILVVDDEQTVADTIALVVKAHGFDAMACYSAHEAISTSVSYAPDLLLTDFDMPRMNGMEAALAVRAIRPDCRVVFLSSIPVPVEVEQEFRSNGQSIIWMTKPVHPNVLLGALKQAFDPPRPHRVS